MRSFNHIERDNYTDHTGSQNYNPVLRISQHSRIANVLVRRYRIYVVISTFSDMFFRREGTSTLVTGPRWFWLEEPSCQVAHTLHRIESHVAMCIYDSDWHNYTAYVFPVWLSDSHSGIATYFTFNDKRPTQLRSLKVNATWCMGSWFHVGYNLWANTTETQWFYVETALGQRNSLHDSNDFHHGICFSLGHELKCDTHDGWRTDRCDAISD